MNQPPVTPEKKSGNTFYLCSADTLHGTHVEHTMHLRQILLKLASNIILESSKLKEDITYNGSYHMS